MKILILALSGLGDALMFSPSLTLLRKQFPDAQIDLLAMFKGVEELYRRNPDISNVYYWNFLKENPLLSLKYVFRLHAEHYNVSVNVYPSNRWPYNVISFMIGAKRRLGHNYNHADFQSMNFLNNVRVHEDDRRHNVEENIELVGRLGVKADKPYPPLHVRLTPDEEQYATEWLTSHNINLNKPIIGYHAGCSSLKNHEKRRWAPDKFARLGTQLQEREGATILLFGGPDEYELNDTINTLMSNNGIVVKVPTLMSSIAIMKRCSVFVVNDSGLMHIAAGLQLPIVTIFAYTNPAYVYPWSTRYIMVRKDLECSPCFYYSPKPATCKWQTEQFRCNTRIEVDEVYQAVESFLQSQRSQAQ